MEVRLRPFGKCRCRPLAVGVWLCSLFTVALGARSTPAATPTVLFVGNSFTFGAGSPVRFFHPESVVDLNQEGIGGVPALFNAFARQAGRTYAVSLETGPGKGMDFHVQEKAAVIGRPWDFVVAHGYSTLDKNKSGDPALLIQTARQLADLLRGQNPQVDIRLVATWSRADQTYPETGHWHGRPIEQMALDLRAAYDRAAAGSPAFRAVIPVGEAWNRAMKTGVADPNPYDGIAAGQIDLWTYDHYHGSTFGYYLSALMIFGDLTGLDPRSLGGNERAALELGLSPAQASALQKVAYDELTATKGRPALIAFKPVKLTR